MQLTKHDEDRKDDQLDRHDEATDKHQPERNPAGEVKTGKSIGGQTGKKCADQNADACRNERVLHRRLNSGLLPGSPVIEKIKRIRQAIWIREELIHSLERA